MITTINGDLLSVTRGHIVHGCNCRGVMGSGVALAVKNKWPEVFNEYHHTCSEHKKWGKEYVMLGNILPVMITTELYVINAFTQLGFDRHARQVDYDAVATCFEHLVRRMTPNDNELHPLPVLPICFPMIGAGLGGGDWDIISTIIDKTVPDTYEKVLYIL